MAVDIGEAQGTITLDISQFVSALQEAANQANSSATQINTSTQTSEQKFNSSVSNVAASGAILTAGITVPVVAAGKAAIETASKFEAGMSQVQAISGATGKDFEALRQTAIQLGADTSFSSKEVADGMTEMAKAGWSSQQIIDGMGGVLAAAAASGEDLSSVSTICADAITGFGLAAKDTTHVADLLTQAANSGTIDITDLGESFKYVAPVASAMGFSIEDCTTALAAMSTAGIKGSQAGTSLRTAFLNMASPTDKVKAAMDKMGLTITDANGNFKDMDTILSEMRTGMEGWTQKEKEQTLAAIGGKTAVAGLMSVVNMSQESYDKIADSMDNCNGVAEKTAAIMQDNLANKWEQFQGALESLAIVLGETFLPILQTIVEKLTEFVQWFTDLPAPIQNTIAVIALLAAAIGPLLVIFATMIKSVQTIGGLFGSLKTIFGGVTTATAPMTTAVTGAGQATASAATSFGTFAGQALKLAATAAVILATAAAVKMLAESAISIAEAGPGAAAAFALLVAGGVAFAAGLTALGTAAQASAVGIVVVSAAVLAVSVGIALVVTAVATLINSFAKLAPQMQTIATYGTATATAILAISAAAVALAVSMVALAAAMKAGLLPFAGAAVTIAAVDLAMAGLAAKVTLATAGFGLMAVALAGIESQLTSIQKTAQTTSDTLSGIQTTVSTVQSAVDTLKTKVSDMMSSLKSLFNSTTTSMNSFKTAVNSAKTSMDSFGTSAGTVKTALSSLKSETTTATTSINTQMNKMSSTTSTASSNMSQQFTKIGTSSNNMATKVSSDMTKAESAVSKSSSNINKQVDSLSKKFSSTQFRFNSHISLPHFGMSGSFNAKTGSVPSVSVSWYKKAMDEGMILNNPTIFGYSQGNFLGAGEAGPEAIVGVQGLMNMIKEAMKEIGTNVYVTMEDGDVIMDNERVGRKVAPVVSRVIRQSS